MEGSTNSSFWGFIFWEEARKVREECSKMSFQEFVELVELVLEFSSGNGTSNCDSEFLVPHELGTRMMAVHTSSLN